MSGRKGGGSGGPPMRTAPKSRPAPPPPPPPPRPRKGGDLIIVQPPRQGPGALGTFAGTAAGVAAGTVIGDKITGKNEVEAAAPTGTAVPAGPCQYEEQQLLGCAQTQDDMQACEAYKQAWLDCKRRFNLR